MVVFVWNGKHIYNIIFINILIICFIIPGTYCERFALRIPYKPLSQRMLEEPFWLGLITVFSVLLIILFVYCIKRKFADKIEKFLAEEIERSKYRKYTVRFFKTAFGILIITNCQICNFLIATLQSLVTILYIF